MDTYISDYLAKADENFSLYTFLEGNDSREILLVPFMNSENPSNLLLQRLKENIDV